MSYASRIYPFSITLNGDGYGEFAVQTDREPPFFLHTLLCSDLDFSTTVFIGTDKYENMRARSLFAPQNGGSAGLLFGDYVKPHQPYRGASRVIFQFNGTPNKSYEFGLYLLEIENVSNSIFNS